MTATSPVPSFCLLGARKRETNKRKRVPFFGRCGRRRRKDVIFFNCSDRKESGRRAKENLVLSPSTRTMPAPLDRDKFLTELHKMFERTKEKGAVSLTTKRSAFMNGWNELENDRRRFFFLHSTSTSTSTSYLLSKFQFRTRNKQATANLKSRNARKPDSVRSRIVEGREKVKHLTIAKPLEYSSHLSCFLCSSSLDRSQFQSSTQSAEHFCLVRASDGKKKITTTVGSFLLFRFFIFLFVFFFALSPFFSLPSNIRSPQRTTPSSCCPTARS